MPKLTIQALFRGYYKRCECGYCNCLIPIFNKMSKYARFEKGHHMKGKNSHNWKGGIRYDDCGYRDLWRPEHPFADNHGYVGEHRLVYEEYYNCCLLPTTVIHHIDEDRLNNKIQNLKPYINNRIHLSENHTKKEEIRNRKCILCGKGTYYNKKKDCYYWSAYKDGHLCSSCKRRIWREEKRKLRSNQQSQ